MDILKKIGRYEILDEIGHGAMGTVYRAKDPAMDRVVALKTIISLMLGSDQGSEFRERFFREARAAGGLSHPGIVTVYDVGEHEGMPYLVMEFISGRTLADAIRKGERLSIDRVCEIGQKIAEALGYAHQHGVVHRDIKPANILLTSREHHGIERPKITDFGVAKLTQGNTTMTGQIVGTPAFMPPEQFTGAPIDGRADIFSLGVVLYWMATGEQPFPGESLTAVSYKVVHTDPVPPSKLNPSVPANLESVILKCLAKNPEERYQTGEELARDLSELRTGGATTSLQGTSARMADLNDPDATLVETFPSGRDTALRTASTIRQTASSPTVQRKSVWWFVAVAVVGAAILVGAWFALRNVLLNQLRDAENRVLQKALPAATVSDSLQTPPNAPPSSASVSIKPASVPTKLNSESQPSTSISKKTEKATEPVQPVDTPKEPEPEPATIDFNPALLDPKTNAKLKIEADHMVVGLNFTVEMNGKVFLQTNAAGNKLEFDNLYVPPGVQEFRVMAGTGASQKVSNTVSTEFQAKKRHTLKIELRSPAASLNTGKPPGLYDDTQIFVSLK